jgi:hypothetical protein
MNNSKKWLYRTLLTVLGIFISIILINYSVDPFQHFRKATFYKPFYKKSRYLNPGIAKTYHYDTVIIGTSMVQNFKPSYVDKVLSVNSVKLPLPGASAYEQSLTLGTALRTGKVKRVLYGLDPFSFNGPPGRFSKGEGSLPFYLYDDDLMNDYKYLLSIDTMVFYKYIIRANLFGKDRRYLELDNYGYWGHRYKFSKEIVIKDWEEASFNRDISINDYDISMLKESFDANFKKHFQDNPDVEFDIFFPPYSVLVWIDTYEKGLVDKILAFRSYVVEFASKQPNVRIFDFQSIGDIVLDLNNYKDVSHYSPSINDFMIDSISTGAHLTDTQKDKINQVKLLNMVHENISRYPR